MFFFLLLLLLLLSDLTTETLAEQPPGFENQPVLAGYDLVAYHKLENPLQDGVPGKPDLSYRHTNGYLYYFANEENRQDFIADPERYLPKYGGFCAWGMAWEYPEDGWPWARNHMGPPCGPQDGWAILDDGKLYCSIWRSYQDDFNRKQEEGIRLADERWIQFYGSLSAGPQNNGCYAWNWQKCYATSIYTPTDDADDDEEEETSNNNDNTEPRDAPVGAPPTPPGSSPAGALFDTEPLSVFWSDENTALDGRITWQWTLQDLATTNPRILVHMDAALLNNNELSPSTASYVAFGVAEDLMQGALIVCNQVSGGEIVEEAAQAQQQAIVSEDVSSVCTTFLGAGMGVAKPQEDSVQPKVLLSRRNATHYSVRFSASLFACWSNPRLPARVLFARGTVSGNGDPQPHVNNALHREAVTGIDFLSVVQGYNVEENRPEDTGDPVPVEPLPAKELWTSVPGSAGVVDILDGRIRVAHELFIESQDGEEIVQVQLQNVEAIFDDTYVGFGFATNVMSGLILTCAPRTDATGDAAAVCHQWRGFGTNLYPLYGKTDTGGWFLNEVVGNGTHVNYTLSGRAADVISNDDTSTTQTSLRAICAVGRSAPDTGTPLIHRAEDRAAFQIRVLSRGVSAAVSSQKSSSSTRATNLPVWVAIVQFMLVHTFK